MSQLHSDVSMATSMFAKEEGCVGSRAIGANKKREYSFPILLPALARAEWIRPREASVECAGGEGSAHCTEVEHTQ